MSEKGNWNKKVNKDRRGRNEDETEEKKGCEAGYQLTTCKLE